MSCERCFKKIHPGAFDPTFEVEQIKLHPGVFLHPAVFCTHERKTVITIHFVWEFYNWLTFLLCFCLENNTKKV